MNRLKSGFLATMSHELHATEQHSRLATCWGRSIQLDDKQKRYVQNIQKSGQDAARHDQRHSRSGEDRKRQIDFA